MNIDSVTDADSGVAGYNIFEGYTAPEDTLEPWDGITTATTAPYVFATPTTDGAKTITVEVRDNVGNAEVFAGSWDGGVFTTTVNTPADGDLINIPAD